MRRIVFTCLFVAMAAAVVVGVLSWRSSRPQKPQYTVELDNAFGVVAGADIKIAGVRAGKVKKLRVDKKTHRALVDFEITKDGFGSLRKDVFCESRPQSLIGEYYIDCTPGKSAQTLKPGSTIPVQRTASTIPLDLVNNILRRPYRERLSIILDELGMGVAGRAQDINDVVRRASPALRETNRVLDKLYRQNQVLKQLITDADKVIGDLAGNRRDVGRFVVEAKQTAQTSAERRADIAASLRRLPGFLRELKPTMAALGAASDANTPALRNLDASANQLQTLLTNLKPFAESSEVNLTSLAETARRGRPAVKAAQPLVDELARATRKSPELANNAAIVLQHLNDRKHAVEKDPRSPGGQGYTGFEAILQWLFDQSQAINTYDKNGYILKVNLFVSKCGDYENPKTLREKMALDPGFYKDCAAILGPNQPGITSPDPTATGRQFASAQRGTKAKSARKAKAARRPARRNAAGNRRGARHQGDGGRSTRRPGIDAQLGKSLQDQLGIDLPDVPGAPQAPGAPAAPDAAQGARDTTGPLLDYLFAP